VNCVKFTEEMKIKNFQKYMRSDVLSVEVTCIIVFWVGAFFSLVGKY